MKRNPTDESLYRIRSIWPILFWLQCVICKQEFRREHGWCYLKNSVHEKIVCCSCCPTIESFVRWLNSAIVPPKGGSGTVRPKPHHPSAQIITKEGKQYSLPALPEPADFRKGQLP